MGLGACIDKVVAASGWKKRRGKLPPGRGLGLACSSYLCGAGLPIYWNTMPQSGVQLKLDRGGGVTVFCGSTDIGQGSDSILASIVAEVLGIDPFDIRVVTADTDLTPVDLGSLLLARHADDRQRRDPGGRARDGDAGRGGGARSSRSRRSASASPSGRVFDVERSGEGDDLRRGGRARRVRASARSAPSARTRRRRRAGRYRGAGVGPSPAYSYSAAVVEVEVDPETGIVTVPKIWIAHDIGKCINPVLVIGQVEGTVYMGLGEALMEEMAYRTDANAQRRAQVPVDARIQEPDDDGDVRRRDLPRRGPRSQRPLRRQGSRAGAAASDPAGGRQRRLRRRRRARRRGADHAGEGPARAQGEGAGQARAVRSRALSERSLPGPDPRPHARRGRRRPRRRRGGERKRAARCGDVA